MQHEVPGVCRRELHVCQLMEQLGRHAFFWLIFCLAPYSCTCARWLRLDSSDTASVMKQASGGLCLCCQLASSLHTQPAIRAWSTPDVQDCLLPVQQPLQVDNSRMSCWHDDAVASKATHQERAYVLIASVVHCVPHCNLVCVWVGGCVRACMSVHAAGHHGAWSVPANPRSDP